MSDKEFFECHPGASRGWDKYEEQQEQLAYEAWADDPSRCAVEMCMEEGTVKQFNRKGEEIFYCEEHGTP